MAAIVANHLMSLLHTRMISSPLQLGGHGPQAHEAWSDILMKLPLMRGRRLYDDLTDVFTAAFAANSGAILWATLNLLHLRSAFFDMMLESHLGLAHVNRYHQDECEIWTRKLIDRMNAYKRGGVNPRKRTHVPEQYGKPVHEWMQ